ncbi:MAG TPA: right-handed parallel beta-helix repeat-containing protein [Acidimicrobiales bacterium]|nr:right-handed parallel beta-helix repeat-containing protein [Acidimicrobiales bacterium]
MSSLRRVVATASGIGLLLGLVVAAPAAANHLTCGQVVTASTSLHSDLVCPDGNGLVLQGNGITLNLNGHTIRGRLETRQVTQAAALGDNGVLGAPYTVRFAPGQFAGVRIRGTRNRVVGPGSIRNFAAGVVIQGGSANTVTRVRVEENLGPPGTNDLGDGIVVFDSVGNYITGNTVRDNGPFDGIGLLGAAGRNVVHGNLVTRNSQPEICPEFDFFRFSTSGGGIVHVCGPTHPTQRPFTFINQQNHGVKFEGLGPGSPYENTITGNTIFDNGNTGVFIPSSCPDFGPGAVCEGPLIRDNVIVGNQVNRNGFGYPTGLPGARLFEGPGNGGSGIVFMTGGPNPPIRHTVRGNTVNENAKYGIAVLDHRPGNPATRSFFIGNTALRNNQIPGGGRAFNAYDGNANVTPSTPCDQNVWRDNNFGRTAADIGGPVPQNNLTNHPCVGPVLAAPG